MSLDINKIRALVMERKIIWKRHALERMLERELSRAVVLQIITDGELIEDYSEDRPSASGLLFGWNGERPIHVVVVLDAGDDQVAVITAHEPTLEHFESDFKTRRK